jgi:putative ABC transport system substrate-binding protein
MAPEVLGKQMQLLKEVIPKVSRLAIVWNPANPSNEPQVRKAEAAARVLGVRLQSVEERHSNDLDRAFAAMSRKQAGAVIAAVDVLLIDNGAGSPASQ